MSKRIASATILVRGHGPELEVFLAERAPQLRFFGGYYAFIGGVREDIDGPDDEDGDSTPLRNCAVRELFEEAGVLADPDIATADGEELAAARAELLDLDRGNEHWARLVTRGRGRATVRECCRITTPPFAPVRYATAFFVVELPAGQEPTIESGELTTGDWYRPSDALAAWRRGEMEIVPPALILLELLEGGDVDAFCARAEAIAQSYRDGILHRVRFSPGIVLAPLETPTLPPATTTNCLIVGTKNLWVIDPASGDGAELARLYELCDALVAEGASIAGVLSTHHHPDHVGGLVPFCERYGQVVRGHPITLERLPEGCPIGDQLHDGDRIDLGTAPDGSDGWQLEAIHTPGHDRGHLCFRESRYGAIVAGDMISTISTIVIDPPEGHLQTYLDSLARLRDLEIGVAYPAHGPAVRQGRRVFDKFIRHRATREATLVRVLGESEPKTAADLVPAVYDDTDPRMYGFAERSLVAGLEKLAEEGRAVCEGDLWRGVDATS